MTNRDLAHAYRFAVDHHKTSGDYETLMLCENEICDRANIDPDETEQGLTPNAVAQIEKWVERHA